MCTDEETMSEHELNERAADNPGRRIRQRGRDNEAAAPLTEEGEALAAIRGDTPTYSKVVLLTAEIVKYIELVKKAIDEANAEGGVPDPLLFWPENEESLPILARVASQVFSLPTANADPERINSPGGLIYSLHRNRIKPKKAPNDLSHNRALTAREKMTASTF